jgi:tetratricopeptide (TPR) repeat protein
MAAASIRERIDKAALALREGNVSHALSIADDVLAIDAASAEANQIRGIALTRLGDVDAAGEAFRRAAESDPTQAKHFYNLAVNLNSRNRPEEALTEVETALRVDPGHLGARQLRAQLTGQALETEIPKGEAQAIREGYSPSRHLLPVLAGMERGWHAVGWTLLAADVALGVLMLVHLPMQTNGHVTPPAKLPDVVLRTDSLSIFIVFLYIVTWVCTFMWMFVDIIDLRRRFSWLVPFLACSILGFTALPLALYMFLGRQTDEFGVT